MKRLGLVLFAVLAVVLGQAPASASALFSVSGTVTVASGYDVTKVMVALQSPDGTTTHKTVNPAPGGTYTFSAVSTGPYRLAFNGPGLQAATLNVSVLVSDVTGADVTLVRLVKLSGTLTSPLGPINGAWLHLWDPACAGEKQKVYVPVTAGIFQTVVPFPGGFYKMLVEPLAHGVPTWYPGQDQCASAQTLDLTADTSLDITVATGGAVMGRVTVAGRPAVGQQVIAYSEQPTGSGTWKEYRTAVTDADGVYRLASLVSGTYKVKVPGWYGEDVAPLEQWYPTPIGISGMQTVTGVDLDLTDGGRISGITTGPQGPHAASVNLHDAVSGNWIGGVASGPDGAWTIMGLAPGDYKLRILDLDGSNLEYFDNVRSLAKATVIHIDTGTRVTGIDVWLGSDDPATTGKPATRTLKATPKRLKVGRTKVLASATVEGEALGWKSTTIKTCRVKKANKAWRVTGKRVGVCRLRASVGTQWSAKVTVRVR